MQQTFSRRGPVRATLRLSLCFIPYHKVVRPRYSPCPRVHTKYVSHSGTKTLALLLARSQFFIRTLPGLVVTGIFFSHHLCFLRCCVSYRPGTDMWCRLSVNTQLLAKVDQLFKVSSPAVPHRYSSEISLGGLSRTSSGSLIIA